MYSKQVDMIEPALCLRVAHTGPLGPKLVSEKEAHFVEQSNNFQWAEAWGCWGIQVFHQALARLLPLNIRQIQHWSTVYKYGEWESVFSILKTTMQTSWCSRLLMVS